MKVALIHDHLNQVGGAERVLAALSELFPQAPIYTLLYDERKTHGFFRGKDIRESFIARLPLARTRLFRAYLPLMPAATEQYDLREYDLVISDSSGFAKGVITHPQTLHICYCHTPTRYLWGDHALAIDPLERRGFFGRISQLARSALRVWDRVASDRVDAYIANSETVRQRILKYYRRESAVIYPPVDVESIKPSSGVGDYFVFVGRARPYKRLDLAISAFNRLAIPLKVIGEGEEVRRLKPMTKANIEFLGPLRDQERNRVIASAQALIHPQEEDFGLTAVEAMAAGRPVIAYGRGGAHETVIPGETGLFFSEQSWESLLAAVVKFRRMRFDVQRIRQHALTFDRQVFKKKIMRFIEERFTEFKRGRRYTI